MCFIIKVIIFITFSSHKNVPLSVHGFQNLAGIVIVCDTLQDDTHPPYPPPADHGGGSSWPLRAKGNQAADLCMHMKLSSKTTYCSLSLCRCVDPHVLKIDHQKEQNAVITRAYQRTCAPVRNAVAFDHFNHFLLYLPKLVGEVEITAWLWCFDAFPFLTALNKRGNPHSVPPSLPSPNLSSAVWCGSITEIKSLINILLFTEHGWRIYTLWFGGVGRLHNVDKNVGIMHWESTDTQIPSMWYHDTHLGFIKRCKGSEYASLYLDLITWLLYNAHRKFMGHIDMPKHVQACGVLLWVLSSSCAQKNATYRKTL